MRLKLLRIYGVTVGSGCCINTTHFSTEPYLIEIGDNVAIASGVLFITHDGSVRLFRSSAPGMDLFGKIKIGDNSFIGSNCILLPNTTIGCNCIVGAGAVVRGVIPDNSVIVGNPAKVVMNTSLAKKIFINHKNCINTKNIPQKDRVKKILAHFANDN